MHSAHAVCLHTHIHIHSPDESAQKYRIGSIHPTSLAFECHVSLPYAYAVFSVCFCFSLLEILLRESMALLSNCILMQTLNKQSRQNRRTQTHL